MARRVERHTHTDRGGEDGERFGAAVGGSRSMPTRLPGHLRDAGDGGRWTRGLGTG